MSRNVPLDKPLTDDDRRYLRDLGAHGGNLEARIDAAFPPDAKKMEKFNLAERKRMSEINGAVMNASEQDLLVAENDRLRAELEALKAGQAPTEAPAEVPNYSGWSKADLEAEVDRVNSEDPSAGLAKGKVADMAAALTEYFAE